MKSSLLLSSHRVQIAQFCMQSKKRRDPCESQTTEETTTAFLRSIAKRYQYRDREEDGLEKVLVQFIDLETGVCLECGQVHDGNRSRRRRGWRKNNSPYLDRLFWPEVPI
jgi:hypothetical protein